MVRQVVTGLAGLAALVVFIVFATAVVTPALQAWNQTETQVIEIMNATWSDEGAEFNLLLKEGWVVTGIRYDGCMNILVDLER